MPGADGTTSASRNGRKGHTGPYGPELRQPRQAHVVPGLRRFRRPDRPKTGAGPTGDLAPRGRSDLGDRLRLQDRRLHADQRFYDSPRQAAGRRDGGQARQPHFARDRRQRRRGRLRHRRQPLYAHGPAQSRHHPHRGEQPDLRAHQRPVLADVGPGFKTSTSPDGAAELPVNPLLLALACGATFVARGFAGEPKHLASLIAAGIRHKGYALIDVLQPCVTFNKVNTYEWYAERIYRVDEETGYDPADFDAAWRTAQQWGDRIPVGIIYQREGIPSYEEFVPALKEGPVVHQPFAKVDEAVFERLKLEYT